MVSTLAARSEFTLRLRRQFAAPREKVFAAWTSPEALRRWWCPPGWLPHDIQIDLREGGAYQFAMQRESGAEVITVHGTFRHIIIPSLLVYTWNWQGTFQGLPETCVTVAFHEVPEGTEVALRHDSLSMRVCGTHLSAWMRALTRLAEM